MKRVLFVYYMFPPMVGGWRAIGSFVKHLPALGWRATVLSAADTVRYPKDYSSLQVPSDVDVHRVGHRERLRKLQFLLNRLRINVDFPDSFKGWYAPALQEGRKILQEQKVDLLFSYGPPYTCHFVTRQLKREYGIPWVAGLADLWSGNTLLINDRTLIQPLRAWQMRRIERGERSLLREADRIIVRCWAQRRQLCAAHGVDEDQVPVIVHGYDESDYTDLQPSRLYPDRLTITHLGSFYQQFQPQFLDFFSVVTEVARDAEVVLVGQGLNLPGVSNEHLTRIMYLPQRKALALGLGSDFLLAVTHPSVGWTMMKIYDYLRLGKPILAVVPDDGDVARIVREAGAGYVLSYERERMGQQLAATFENWRKGVLPGFRPDREYIAGFERGNLTRQMVRIFEGVSS